MKGTVYMSLGPFHNLAHFIPVQSLFTRHIIQWCSGNDHPVIATAPDLIEGIIELLQMMDIRMSRSITGCLQEIHLNLKRRIG